MDIFKLTTRPDSSLFFKSYDVNDKKLGDIVACDESEYKSCRFVIVGCPQDEGVRRNNGRPGAAEAPDKIRQALYRISVPAGIKAGQVFDIGNTILGTTLEKTHRNQTDIVSKFVTDGKLAIVLGGGNDISYPDCVALSKKHLKFLAINVDSHFDVRENKQRNSGTPYRQLLEENIIDPKYFFELAIQPLANSDIYSSYLKKKKVTVLTLDQLREKGVEKTLRHILKSNKSKAVFWGIDMDSVRSADAPGVSASYPTGLTAEELLTIGAIAGRDKRSKILEISEVNPKFDIDGRTCKLAAMVIACFLNHR